MVHLPDNEELTPIPDDIAATVFEMVRSVRVYGELMPQEALPLDSSTTPPILIGKLRINPDRNLAWWRWSCSEGHVYAAQDIEKIIKTSVISHRNRELTEALMRVPAEWRRDLSIELSAFRNTLIVCGDGRLFWQVVGPAESIGSWYVDIYYRWRIFRSVEKRNL